MVRADGAASERVRERIQSSARTTAVISVAAVLISVLSLFLILRENRRQRDLVRVSTAQRRAGRAGEPGQVALPHHDEPRAAQSAERHPRAAGAARAGDLVERQRRLVAQAQNSGRSMLQMLNGHARLRRGPGRAHPPQERALPRRRPRRRGAGVAARRGRRAGAGRGGRRDAGAGLRRPRSPAADLPAPRAST